MSHRGRLNSFAPIAIAALIGLAGVASGDNTILQPVRVESDTANMATQSYKFCWTAMREVNGMREDRFFAEPIVESKGHKLAPADTTLTIQSQNGPVNVPFPGTGRSRIFQFQPNCWQRTRWSFPISPRALSIWPCRSESQSRIRRDDLNTRS